MTKQSKNTDDWRQRDPDHARERKRYDRPVPSRELILRDLEAGGKPLTRVAIRRSYDLKDERDTQALDVRLDAMLRGGQLVENRRGALGPIARMDLVRGRVQGHRDGFGFLIPDEGGEDVFLNPRQMRELMHGDRAVVQVTGTDRRGRREGRVADVLERANNRVVGRLIHESGVSQVVPDNPRINQDILIPQDALNGAVDGQIVTADLVGHPGKRKQPVGRVAEILGEQLDPGMEIDIAVRAHGIPYEWPAEALAQAEGIGEEVPADQYAGREDLRELPLVTIDGADARDFDDAVHCHRTKRGWKLWVAIADVSAYVQPDSALDAEAHNRGTSVYFPENVIPMLPEALSNGLCSLNPEVDRLCLVCELQINREGEIGRSRFFSAVMRSHARFTYDEVAGILADPASAKGTTREPLVGHLQELHALYQALFAARQKRGAIDFESTETKIVFNADRKIERIEPVERTDAHRLIEECMIAANVAAASYLTRKRMPTLYRVHTRPDAEKISDLREFLSERGLSLGGGDQPQAADYARLLQQLEDRDDARMVQTVLLRSLTRAVYSPTNDGHFGLALDYYGHFTSPIRRYPDLLVHRALKHQEAGGKARNFEYTWPEMETLGSDCSAAERRADDATRDVDDWLKCEFMRDRVGDEFDGQIVGVTAFGLFVELDGIYATGLVHVSSLSNDFYHFDARAHCLRGERSGAIHRLGDRLRVQVMRVDLDERKIDFEPVLPAKGAGGKKQQRTSNSKGNSKGQNKGKGNKNQSKQR